MNPAGFAAGILVLSTLTLCAVFAPAIATEDPTKIVLSKGLAPPSLEAPFGRDKLGRDQLSRVIYGARVSLAVGTSTVVCSLVLGSMVGSIAGYLGGRVDFWLMRLVDILLAFPGILLAIALSAVLGPHILNTVVALSLIGWTGYARLVRIEVLAIMQRPHVEAARALGTPPLRLVAHHILPIVAVPIAVQATFSLAAAIVAEASLSFLGLGVQPPTPSWGSMINESRGFILIAPHLAVIPGTALFMAVLALNGIGEGLRQRLNVRSTIRPSHARPSIADNADSKNWTAAPRPNA